MKQKHFKWYLCLILSFLFNFLTAQNTAVINFNKYEYDFGRFPEKGGMVSTVFEFTNSGKAPLVVNQVIASCGCTTPVWTKSPVEPGKTGQIEIIYNPAGRPGLFIKNIIILSNASNNRVELRIKGEVETSEILRAVQFPVIMGDLRLEKRSIQVGDISSSASFESKIQIYNASEKPLNIKFAGVPRHIRITPPDGAIEPKQTIEVPIIYEASAVKDWGTRKDDFYVLYNNETRMSSDRRIIVSAVIKEDFSKLTQVQRDNAPKIEVSEPKIDFGMLLRNQKAVREITIKNTGKSVLHIRKITCENTAIKPAINRMSIPAGGEATLKVSFDAASLKKAITENVVILTNDPEKSSQTVQITATSKL
ncbi:MAG: DUF1573 domain-containing protein [Bacteroidales bacterium]